MGVTRLHRSMLSIYMIVFGMVWCGGRGSGILGNRKIIYKGSSMD